MINYPSTNILVSPLDYKSITNLGEVKTYLEINGNSYGQNVDNPNKKEYHYFMGNSVVFITELSKKADIEIISRKESSLNSLKSKIEGILDRD